MTASTLPPLVVDLDGTLTPSDTLMESVVLLARVNPLYLLCLPWWLLQGRARLKERIAEKVSFDASVLCWNEPFVAWLREQKAAGRRIILSTAAHESIAQAVAAELGLFDQVMATRDGHNNKGAGKLAAIESAVGPHFVYAGDSRADLAIWPASKGAVLVGASAGVAAAARQQTRVEAEFDRPRARLADWVRLLRPHHWAKNLLLFVPLLTSFQFNQPATVMLALLAFAAFSLLASATYILNDIWDIHNDRSHPRKRLRAIARCVIGVPQAVLASAALFAASLVLACQISPAFTGVLLAYMLVTTLYSFHFKKVPITDVMLLSLLFTLRIFAGATAIEVQLSSWLMAFSVFIFFCLALVKRCAELMALMRVNQLQTVGRGYHVEDLPTLTMVGIGAGLCAVVVLGLFIAAPETQARYAHPQVLWGIGVVLIHWIARIWLATTRGEMDDDPLVYSLKDRASQLSIAAMIGLTLLAK